ncbi:MAG: MFS transporter [Flavitalea sp.]
MKMKTGEFIALSACTMMLTALGIDIMLPVFGELREHFGLPEKSTATAQIIVFFFMGQVAQIIFGAMADRYGRLAILRIGFPLYIAAGVAATFAPTLSLMYVARFFAGVGSSAVFMTTIAGVRDRFKGDEMARVMSLILTIFLFTPVFAPFLGIAILNIASWQVVFLTPPLFAAIVFVWSFRLEESLPKDKRAKINWGSFWSNIKHVSTNKIFARYTLITTLLFSVLSSWVASSERIVGEIYKRPDLFSWIFAGIGAVMSFCSLMNSKLAKKFGARKTVKWSLLAYLIVGLVLLVSTLMMGDPPPMPVFFGGICLLMALNLAIEPNSSSIALEPMGDTAGIAAAVYGTFFFFVGSGLGALMSHYLVDGVVSIVIGSVAFGAISYWLVLTDRYASALNEGER